MRLVIAALLALLPSMALAQRVPSTGGPFCSLGGCTMGGALTLSVGDITIASGESIIWSGQVQLVNSTTTLRVRNSGNTDHAAFEAGGLTLLGGGTQFFLVETDADTFWSSGGDLCWSATGNASSGTKDTCINRLSASNARLSTTNGGTVLAGWLAAEVAGTIAADDTTPDVAGATVWTTSANTGATAITDLDNPSPRSIVIICGGSATNSSTIADSGNFNLSGAFTAGLDDCIALYVQADNDYVELYRVNN